MRNTHWICFSIFVVLVAADYTFSTPARGPTAQPEPHGDGFYYYSYLRSLAFDRDVIVNNDYELMGGPPYGLYINPDTKRAHNVFSVGPAIVWLPFVPLGYLVESLARSKQPTPAVAAINGTEPTFQRGVLFGSVVAGCIAVALGLWLAMNVTLPSLATIASIGICLGSPLIWFMLRQPSFSHAPDAAVVALFTAVWFRRAGERTVVGWAGLGSLLGLAMLVRPPNVAHVVLPLAEWLYVTYPKVRARDRAAIARSVGSGLVFSATAGLSFLPALLIWRDVIGRWVSSPYGPGFMDWSNSHWQDALFTSRAGLFAWHPLLLVAVTGLLVLPWLPRISFKMRAFAALGIASFLLQAYLNGAALDWWAGWSFGGRRFMSCTPYFIVGLAAVLEVSRRFVVAYPVRVAQVAAALLVLVFALYNRSLMNDYLTWQAPAGEVQAMKPRIAGAFTKTLDEVYRVTGNPGSFPANALFAMRARVSPERYDYAAGNDFLSEELGDGRTFYFDDFHGMGGFEPGLVEALGRKARLLRSPTACWVFALRKRRTLDGSITLGSPAAGAHVTMKLGDRTVFDQKLDVGWRDYPIKLPRTALTAGMNYIEVSQYIPKGHPGVYWEKGLLKRYVRARAR